MKQCTSLLILLMSCMAFSTINRATEPPDKKPFGDNILLIINYHFAYYESIELLKKIYSPYFPHIVFYGPQEHHEVELCDHHWGWYSYKDIALAMQKYPDYAGYLLINDDLIINPKNFERFDKTKLWMCPYRKLDLTLGLNAINDWPWWQSEVGYTVMKQVYEKLEHMPHTMLINNLGDNMVVMAYSDIAYIPAQCAQEFIKLSFAYEQHKVFLEITLPTICFSIIPKEQIQYINGKPLWYDGERSHPCDYLNQSVDYVHPIKLSNAAYREFIENYFKKLM